MSIVGTRPPLISETNLYEPHHKATSLKIMGMWPDKGWMPWMLPPGVCRAVVVCIR